MADFFNGFPTRSTLNHIPWKLYGTQLVKLVIKFMNQQLKCEINCQVL